MLLRLLPGLYVCGCGIALAAALRRWLDPLPWRVAIAILFLVLALFHPVLFGGELLLPLDNLRGHVPFQRLPAPRVHGNYLQADLVTLIAPAQARLRVAHAAGEWGLWNPLVGTGVPLLADPQAQALQPLQLLAAPFALATAAGVVAALRVLVALLFTFLLLRRQGVGEGASLAGAFAWGLGGYLMLWLGWPLANVAALLPMALWATTLALDRGGRRDLAALAFATLALALGGHPETALYAGLFVAAFAVSRAGDMTRIPQESGVVSPSPLPEIARHRLRRAAAAAALGGVLSLPVALPAAHAAAQSERAAGLLARRAAPPGTVHVAAPEWERSWGSFALGRLLPVVAPNAFGNGRYLHYWGPDNSNEDASGFVGSATVLLALLGMAGGAWQRRSGPAATGATGAAVGIAIPRAAAPGSPLARLRPQERLLQATVAVSLLLVVLPPGLRPWADRLPLALQSTSYYHRLLLLAGFGLACLAAYELDRVARGTASRAAVAVAALGLAALVTWATLAHPHPGQPDTLEVLRLGWLRWHLRFLAATAVVLALGRGRRWAAPLVALLVAAELLLAHAPANPPMPPALGFPRLPVLSFLAERGDGQRLIGLEGALPPNLAALYGLADLRAYDPMAPAACARALAGFDALDATALATPVAPARRQLADLGVRYLLAKPGTPVPPGYRRAFADETATLLEGPALSVARFAGGAAAGAAAGSPRWRRSPARWSTRLPQGDATWLVTTLCQDGGWRVLADGRPLPRAAGRAPFLVAAMPPSTGAVELLYRPAGFLAGCLLAALAATAAALQFLSPPRARLSAGMGAR